MTTIVLDTDFLSSFLKIQRCDLIRSFYLVEQAYIPTAVHRELAQTDLLKQLVAHRWIVLAPVEPSADRTLENSRFQSLGQGEQDCILLARTLPDAVLLINDNQARRFARTLGLDAVSIPAFLLACKMAGLVNADEMVRIISDLKDKDFYEFKAEIRDLLLE